MTTPGKWTATNSVPYQVDNDAFNTATLLKNQYSITASDDSHGGVKILITKVGTPQGTATTSGCAGTFNMNDFVSRFVILNPEGLGLDLTKKWTTTYTAGTATAVEDIMVEGVDNGKRLIMNFKRTNMFCL